MCLYSVTKPEKKETIDVGCKLEVRYCGMVYTAKV